MHVVNYNWDVRTSAETRKKVLDLLMPFIQQKIMYERILSKAMRKMSLHSDIFRFLRKNALVVYRDSEKVNSLSPALPFLPFLSPFSELVPQSIKPTTKLYTSQETANSKDIKELLTLLCEEVGDNPSLFVLEEHFEYYVRGGTGLAEQLKNFFSSDNELFNDDMALITILKCISSDMYFPAYLALREAFFSVFPFKDVRGTGSVSLQFLTVDDENKGGTMFKAVHRKKEASESSDPARYFEFEWELCLNLLSLQDKTLETSLKIVDFTFGNQLSPELKMDLISAWYPFLTEDLKKRHPTLSPNPIGPISQTTHSKGKRRSHEMRRELLAGHS